MDVTARQTELVQDTWERLEEIKPAVEDLGRRHAAYGVREDHYGSVGAALLWTLEKGLGDEFTREVEEAWAAVYGLLAGLIKEAGVRELVVKTSREEGTR